MDDCKFEIPSHIKRTLWIDERMEFPRGMAIYPTGCDNLLEAIDTFYSAYGYQPGYIFRLEGGLKWHALVGIKLTLF